MSKTSKPSLCIAPFRFVHGVLRFPKKYTTNPPPSNDSRFFLGLKNILAASLFLLGQEIYSPPSYAEQNNNINNIQEENNKLVEIIHKERGKNLRINETYVANDEYRLELSYYSIDDKIYTDITATERTGGFWFSMFLFGRTYSFTISDSPDKEGKYGSVDRISFSFSDNSDKNKSIKVSKKEEVVNPEGEYIEDINKAYGEILKYISKKDSERNSLIFDEMENLYEKHFKQNDLKPFSRRFYLKPWKANPGDSLEPLRKSLESATDSIEKLNEKLGI